MADTKFIKSKSIEVFPSGFRGTGFGGSKLTSEKNITKLNILSYNKDNNNQVYEDPDDSTKIIFILHGYYFRVDKNAIPENTKYAYIKIMKTTTETELSADEDQLGPVLAKIGGTTAKDVLDAKNGDSNDFYGLGFCEVENDIPVPTLTDNYKIYSIQFKDAANNFSFQNKKFNYEEIRVANGDIKLNEIKGCSKEESEDYDTLGMDTHINNLINSTLSKNPNITWKNLSDNKQVNIKDYDSFQTAAADAIAKDGNIKTKNIILGQHNENVGENEIITVGNGSGSSASQLNTSFKLENNGNITTDGNIITSGNIISNNHNITATGDTMNTGVITAHRFATGTFPDLTSEGNSVIMIGNGTGEGDASNIFKINNDGDITTEGQIYVDGDITTCSDFIGRLTSPQIKLGKHWEDIDINTDNVIIVGNGEYNEWSGDSTKVTSLKINKNGNITTKGNINTTGDITTSSILNTDNLKAKTGNENIHLKSPLQYGTYHGEVSNPVFIVGSSTPNRTNLFIDIDGNINTESNITGPFINTNFINTNTICTLNVESPNKKETGGVKQPITFLDTIAVSTIENADDTTLPPKLGTAETNIGHDKNFIYLEKGIIKNSVANVGNSTHPIYLKDGSFEICDVAANGIIRSTTRTAMGYDITLNSVASSLIINKINRQCICTINGTLKIIDKDITIGELLNLITLEDEESNFTNIMSLLSDKEGPSYFESVLCIGDSPTCKAIPVICYVDTPDAYAQEKTTRIIQIAVHKHDLEAAGLWANKNHHIAGQIIFQGSFN